MFKAIQKRLLGFLHNKSLIQERVQMLMTIPGIGEVTALTWVLEVGETERFPSIKDAVSYCGLCNAQKESAGRSVRGPISKKRNQHLQHVLIEAAKIAPIWDEQLANVHARVAKTAHRNTATLAVARKMVAYMLAVERSGQAFEYKSLSKAA